MIDVFPKLHNQHQSHLLYLMHWQINVELIYFSFTQKVEVDPRVEHAELTMKTNVIGTLNVIHCLLPLFRPHGR